jgi:predicted transcriptional regulator
MDISSLILSYIEFNTFMAQVQLIVEVDEEFKETLKTLAKKEDRTLKAFVTRALKDAAIARAEEMERVA